MKISKLTNGLLVSLLLSASVVEANSDYPATNFQPKIVYQDTDYKHTGSTVSSSSSKSFGEVSQADSNYPAANFQPEILYKDDSYKHTKGKVTSLSASSSGSVSSVEEATEAVQADSEESSMNLIMGLAVLAIAGFVFYSKSAKKATPAKKGVVRRAAVASKTVGEAVSGVDKYLEGKVGAIPSGVSKYLDERNSEASSVAKYVAKQKVSARLASVTGVEKYLKDRG